MGESVGASEAYTHARTEEDIQNVCKWCDEFFEQHFDGPLVASEKPKPVPMA